MYHAVTTYGTMDGGLRQPTRQAPRGFALVVTISVLVLLALIAIGLLSLSAVTVRSGGRGEAQLEARANARLALMIALGELQIELGPDQRVSAAAGVLDEDSDTLGIDRVAHPHWTAVWDTRWSDGSTVWRRRDDQGGLRDQRASGGWDREKSVRSYLVSGNEGASERGKMNLLDARDATLSESEGIWVVGPGTVESQGGRDSNFVRAKRVATSRNGVERGGYAYWVGDLGVKANLAVVDPFRDADPRRPGGPDGIERLLHAQDVADESVDGLGSLTDTEALKLISERSVSLAKGVDTEGAKARFHDLTTLSRSVLVNVRESGLQRDLTAYVQGRGDIDDLLVGGQVASRGMNDSDRIAGPANVEAASAMNLRWPQLRYRDISPRFGLLRNWVQKGMRISYSDLSIEAIEPKIEPNGVRGSLGGAYDRTNRNPVSIKELDSPNVVPVVVDSSLYYNLVAPSRPLGSSGRSLYGLRLCLYPRVALWNPYNVRLEFKPSMMMLHVNGSKRLEVEYATGPKKAIQLRLGRPGVHLGTFFWKLPAVELEPGETLVFSADQHQKYDSSALQRNTLSPHVAPTPGNCYYLDLETPKPQLPVQFLESPIPGQTQADDYRMCLKPVSESGVVNYGLFDNLPQIMFANCSLQYGGLDELPVQWSQTNPVEIEILPSLDAQPTQRPDVRTRDGFRLRWFREHFSNLNGSGTLSDQPAHFQTAALGNWNPRAAYHFRTPWENVTDSTPAFYGVYTRDLFDQAVSWDDLMPMARGGRMVGNPFGSPQDGLSTYIAFEVPRREIGIPSIGYLQHLKMSEFGWHPSYAVGNSQADPRVGRTSTSPVLRSARDRQHGGWNQHTLGWAPWGGSPDYWARWARGLLQHTCESNNLVYDLSYELNYSLWDDFFFSTGTPAQKRDFVDDPEGSPLPNGRMGIFTGGKGVKAEVTDFHRAASRFSLEGGFNVHSVSKEAWKAVLGSTRDTGYGSGEGTPFPRILNSPGGEWLQGLTSDEEGWAGFRSLSDGELDLLAEEIVREVKERAPFLGLADFVNRRLDEGPAGEKGPLQAAIDAASLNERFEEDFQINNEDTLKDFSAWNIADATKLDQTLKPRSTAWGAPGFLTQADILQVIGSSLRARSDTFMVRSYGESLDANGEVQARAWCEAVVQRTPEPVYPDHSGLNPELDDNRVDFGRRFRIVSFRWLSRGEV